MANRRQSNARQNVDRYVFEYPSDNPDEMYFSDAEVADSAQTMCIGGKNYVGTNRRAPQFGNALKNLFNDED